MKLKLNLSPASLLAAAVVLPALLLIGCSKPDSDKAATTPDKGTADSDKAAAEPKAGVTLDAETRERLGLKIESPAPARWVPETKVYGQVLDTAPLMDQLVDLKRAEIALDAAQREWDRAKQLKAGDNISDHAYRDAETACTQARAEAEAVRLKIQTAWGRKIAELTGPLDVPAGTERTADRFLDSLRGETALVRVDLPPGARLENAGQTARILSLAGGAAPVAADGFDLLPAMDPQTQQQGVLFSAAQPPANRLIPGEAVTVFLKAPGEPVSGVLVPPGAVLRYEGAAWVYVQTGANQFARTAITLDRLMAGGWFVADDLSVSNHIVIAGAQATLSAELSSGQFTTGERD